MSEEVRRISVPITGMTCAAYARRLEKVLSKTGGVSGAGVNLATGKASVEYDPDVVGPGELVRAVEGAGYGVEVRETSLVVSGMSCASCVGRVEKALTRIPGVLDANVNLVAEKARVGYLPGMAETKDFERALKGAGYAVTRERAEVTEAALQREYGKLRNRFLVAAVLTGFILLGNLPIMLGFMPLVPVRY